MTETSPPPPAPSGAEIVDRRPARQTVSIVCPVYNEEDNVVSFYQAVSGVAELEAEKYDFEFIFTDNHSADQTFEVLRSLAEKDRRIRVFRFSRNFGYQRSIYTAYMKATGDVAVQLDCDLQDPPEMISDFLRRWEGGATVVYGIRRSRREGFVITAIRRLFYRLLNSISDTPLPADAGDFRLIDRVIIEQLRLICDTDIYIRGRIATMGFCQVGVPYDRRKRLRGTSKFRFRHNLRLAIDAVTAHSALPLRLASYFGVLVTLTASVGGVAYLVTYMTASEKWPAGFATVVFLLLFMLGVISLFLGIIGEYLSRIYDQLKGCHNVIIEKSINSR